MVIVERSRERLLVLQLLAVLSVCFNHFSITMLKNVDVGISPGVYANTAVWGLNFLFLSSGYLLHTQFAGEDLSWPARAELIFRRYWRLMPVVAVAVLADILIVSFADFGNSRNTLTSVPFLLTLSQTWYYHFFGQVSLALPIGGGNMAWLSADLFFCSVVYALSAGLWQRLRTSRALILLAVMAAVYAAYHFALIRYAANINDWSALRYGADVIGAYTVWSWLYEYAPYSHVVAFLCGVVVAQVLRAPSGMAGGTIAGMLIIAFVLVLFGGQTLPQFLGLNIALLVLIVLRGDRDIWPRVERSAFWLAIRANLVELARYSYEIYVLHLVIFLPFTITFLPAPGPGTGFLLAGRVIAATAIMLLLCYGISKLVTDPVRHRVLRWFGLDVSEDRFA